MRKFVLIIFSILILTSCSNKNDKYEDLKKTIIHNLERIELKTEKNPDYNYLNNRFFRKVVRLGRDAVPILSELYYEGELDETSKFVVAHAIEKITECNIYETYGLKWNTPEEFFEIWKNNNCSYEEAEFKFNTIDSLLDKYFEFSEVVKECKINLPIFHDMIPQGIAEMKNYILITAYDNQGENSKCYILNKLGEIVNIVSLDMNSHVGSIAYDETRDFIWIPGNNGRLNIYSGQDFLTKSEVKAKWIIEGVSEGLVNYLDKDRNQIAYLTLDKDFLYIGSFSIYKKGTVKKYQVLDGNDNIKLKFINSFTVPKKVQGITFYERNNHKYMLLSRSYGRHNYSYLNVYEYNESLKDYTSLDVVRFTLKMPPLLEQVSQKNELYAIFESNAKKYDNCLDKVGSVCILNVDKLIDSFIEKQELKRIEQEKKEKEKENKKKEKKEKIKVAK